MTDTHLTPAELEVQIEAQREHLADTVDQLTHKLDLKAQARARLSRMGPREFAVVAVGSVALVALVWWRRSR